jgi:hypothetical protein
VRIERTDTDTDTDTPSVSSPNGEINDSNLCFVVWNDNPGKWNETMLKRVGELNGIEGGWRKLTANK